MGYIVHQMDLRIQTSFYDLLTYGFRRVQGSLYVCDLEDLANLMDAIDTLKQLPWFPDSVRDIRAFKIEQWSDFTKRVKR